MRKFLNLFPKDSKGLDKPIYRNALNLKRDAIFIAEKRESYSTSTALLILSAEECIKSILVLLHSENFRIYEIKDSKKFFYDHVIRHQIGMFVIMGLEFQTVFNNEFNLDPAKVQNLKSKNFGDLLSITEDILKKLEPLYNATNRDIEYLQEFNEIKNNGFYVDYRDRLIVPKEKITFEDYSKTLKINNKIFKFNKQLRILFHEKIENHMEKKKIEEAKNYIKEIIDDGMKIVKFEELKKK
ncbi:AbiV family abortive infection protein [Polaribacter marinivivus]|uniref:AbiV family abortive infection protein n=1 Tax=Polaribacter marinivivus TaxID=1524260 RepID=A0ABV8R6A1_9FLAO